jgi:hypothetical protein
MSEEILNIRSKLWDRQFPGILDDFQEIFGTVNPKMNTVRDWKSTWIDASESVFYVNNANDSLTEQSFRNKIQDTAAGCGVHHYFFQLVPFLYDRTVVFYREQDLVMFKLAWMP